MDTERRHIWDLNCMEKDVVLASSFGWQELEALCKGAGLDPSCDCPHGLPRDYAVCVLAHEACHEGTGAALRIEGFLNRVHRAEVRLVSESCPGSIHQRCVVAEMEHIPNLPGLLWAVLSDPREELRCIQHYLIRRTWMQGLRTLVFGSWTVANLKHKLETLEAAIPEARRVLSQAG